MSREIRYVLSEAPDVELTAEYNDYDAERRCYLEDERTFIAKLIDVSQHGLKLASRFMVPTGESVRLRLAVKELGFNLYLAGRVCWIEAADSDTFLVGCTVDTGLPSGLLDRLAAKGYVDRRFDSCFDEEIEVSGLWELDGIEVPVTIRNYSSGGFSVATKHPIVAGQRISLSFGHSDQGVIVGVTQWQLEISNGYLIGATFLRHQDFERLEGLCHAYSTSASLCS